MRLEGGLLGGGVTVWWVSGCLIVGFCWASVRGFGEWIDDSGKWRFIYKWNAETWSHS